MLLLGTGLVGIGGAVRRAHDLLELFLGIERKGAHLVSEISLGDRFLGFHRVHEAKRRLRQRLGDEADLGDRGDVIMGDAFLPQDPKQIRRGIGLHRIEHAAVRQRPGEGLIVVAHDFEVDDEARLGVEAVKAAIAQKFPNALGHSSLPNGPATEPFKRCLGI